MDLLIYRFPVCEIGMMARNKNICTRTSFIFFFCDDNGDDVDDDLDQYWEQLLHPKQRN